MCRGRIVINSLTRIMCTPDETENTPIRVRHVVLNQTVYRIYNNNNGIFA